MNILSTLLISPLIGLILVLLIPEKRMSATGGSKNENIEPTVDRSKFLSLHSFILVSVLIATICFLISAWGKIAIDSSKLQISESYSWIPFLGVKFLLAADSLTLTFASTVLALVTILVIWSHYNFDSWNKNNWLGNSWDGCSRKYFSASILVLIIALFGVFFARDGILFYIFWELMLIPVCYFIFLKQGLKGELVGSNHNSGDKNTLLYFVAYTLLGTVGMLVSLLFLATKYSLLFGELSFSFNDLSKVGLNRSEGALVAAGFLLAFAVKIPLFPLHSWLPKVISKTSFAGVIIFISLLFLAGFYGMIRLSFMVVPEGTTQLAPLLATFAMLAVIYGAFIASNQKNWRGLIAFSSISHLGYCVLGFASLNHGIKGAVFHLISHAISAAGVLFVIAMLLRRGISDNINDNSGLATKLPKISAFLFIILLGYIAVPLSSGFIGEFLIFSNSIKAFPILTLISITGVIWTATYMVSAFVNTFYGEFKVEQSSDETALKDLSLREFSILIPFVILTICLGLYPNILLNLVNSPVENIIKTVSGVVNSEILNF